METLFLVVEFYIAHIIPKISIKTIVQKYLANNNGKKFPRKLYSNYVGIKMNNYFTVFI